MSGFTLSMLVDNGILVADKEPTPFTNNGILATFTVETFAMGVASSMGIASLIALITRQGTFAIYATIIWVLGLLFNVTQWIISGFPKMISWLLAGTGLEGWAITFFLTMFGVYAYFFLAGYLSGNQTVSPG